MTEYIYERRKFISIVLGVLCLFPLMLSHTELWDTCTVEMATLRSDFYVIEHYFKYGWYMPYWTYLFLHEVELATGVPYKFFINILMLVSLVGVAREIFWFTRNRFGLEPEYAYVAFWAALAFPIWHIFISTAVFINIACMWFFMLAVRFWYSKKLLSLFFFLLSIQFFSVFSMAIGFVACDYLLTVTRSNWVKKTVRSIGVSSIVLIGYIVFTSFVGVNGKDGNYNRITVEHLAEYLPILVAYCCAIAGAGYAMSFKISDAGEKQRLVRAMLAISVLLFFAILPYNAVGRPMRYFAFGSHTARHTMLSAIPLAMLLGVVIRYIALNFNRKVATSLAAFILVAQVVILHQGYSHKAAALVFKDMMTDSFKETEAPLSGYVAIQAVGYEGPRHVNNSAINLVLAKAYGKSAWMANGYWRRKRSLEPESMKALYGDTLGFPMCVDVTGEAYTKYTFTLSDFHQEGRFWYWYLYLAHDYAGFKPQLKKVRELERWDMETS